MQIITDSNVKIGDKIAVSVGVFDGVHIGHCHLLSELVRIAGSGGMASVAITFENHPLEVISRQSRPLSITSLSRRLELISASGVEYCRIMKFTPALKEMNSLSFLNLLQAQFSIGAVVAGYNNAFGRCGDLSVEEATRKLDIAFHRASPVSVGGLEVSSSTIRKLLSECRIPIANKMLGRCFELEGTVVHGKAIGRTIGFPTANIDVDVKDSVIPGRGVYACAAIIDNNNKEIYGAMVNIGDNPTVDEKGTLSIEAHLIGIPEGIDLYGHKLCLFFLDFMREECKFSSLDALKRQLERDCKMAANIFDSSKISIFAKNK